MTLFAGCPELDVAFDRGTHGDLSTAKIDAMLAGYEANSWFGIGVPKGTSPEITAKLSREIDAGLTNPAVKARLTEIGTNPMILTAEPGRQSASH